MQDEMITESQDDSALVNRTRLLVYNEPKEIRLTRLNAPYIETAPGFFKDPWSHVVTFAQQWGLFIVVAVLPIVLSGVYYFGVESDRFTSEALFAIRTQQEATNTISGALHAAGEHQGGGDPSNIVKEYILSRDALELLVSKGLLPHFFQRDGVDRLSRYPNIFSHETHEHLYEFYLRLVSMQYDSATGVSKLSINAFSADDAMEISSALISASEVLINSINERAQADAVASAEKAVAESRSRAFSALDRLTAFRAREEMLDPIKMSMNMIESISGMSVEVAKLKSQLSDNERMTPNSPQLAPIRNRIAALEQQIMEERSKLGGGENSLAPKLAEYERISLDREFAEKAYLVDLGSLDAARLDAQRQKRYIERISGPNLPDYPNIWHRFSSFFTIAIIAFTLFVILQTFLNNILAHKIDLQ